MNFESFLDETFELNDLPGLAVGIGSTKSDLTKVGVRGYSDYVNRVPLHEDTIFHCASVSKLFTSSAIMMLVEARILHLDDRLADLLPDLNIADKRWENIQLIHMLTHTSGLGDCTDYHWDTPLYDEDALRNYVYSDEVCKQPMLWDAGSGFRYSNVAYEILGHIVSVYSQRIFQGERQPFSYEDFIQRYCLEPAQMSSSTMKTFERDASDDMAVPHQRNADRSIVPVKHYPYTRQHAPSSTLTSNINDLLSWGKFHLGKMAFQYETYDKIWQPYADIPNNGEQMGIGWFIRKQTVSGKEYTLYGHEGSDDGFRSSFWICPELDTVTVVLSNLSDAPVKKINKKLFALATESLNQK